MQNNSEPALSLAGQCALVTGSGTGIGRAIARALAAAGASVVVNYFDHAEKAHAVVSEIEEAGGRATALQADVGDEDQVRRMFRDMFAAFGTIDILVNNAGIQKDSPVHRMSLRDWNRVLATNLTGQFLCAREAAVEFMRRGVVPRVSCAAGKIICISSVHDTIPWAGHANYAASKGGVMMLMKTLAQELAEHKIRVNGISPGAIRTGINKPAWSTPEATGQLNTLIPWGRIGEPIDVARLAVWLASDLSTYITGTTVYVDGGMMLYPGFREGG